MDLRRWYVTKNLARLQGRRLLPFVALLVMSIPWLAGWVRLPGDDSPRIATLWFLGLLAVAAVTSGRTVRWYRRRYDDVMQESGDSLASNDPLAPKVAIGLVCVPILVEIQQRFALPFSLPIAVLATVVGAYGVAAYPLRRHYLAAAAVLYACVPLRVLGVPAAIGRPLVLAGFAIALAIAAIGDHRLIAKTLEAQPTDVSADAGQST